MREIEGGHLSATRVGLLFDAAEKATREVRIPGEPEVVEALLDRNTTPAQLRAICEDALMSRTIEVEPGVVKEVQVPAWPIPPGSTFPMYLSQYAEQYVVALRDPRFPRCDVSMRPSTRLKQFWFLSRALAGALYGISTRTAINLVGSMRPEQVFHESRAGKPARRKAKTHHESPY